MPVKKSQPPPDWYFDQQENAKIMTKGVKDRVGYRVDVEPITPHVRAFASPSSR